MIHFNNNCFIYICSDEPVAGVEAEKPKKSRSEAIDRWGHDMFDPNQQGPKSDQELVDLYGYDIRQEEGAPRYEILQRLFPSFV